MEEPNSAGNALKAVAIAVVLLVVLFPLYVVVLTSISTQTSVAEAGGLVIVPHSVTFGAYTDLFSDGVVTRSVMLQLVLRAYVLQGQPIPGVSSVQQAAANSITGAVPTLPLRAAPLHQGRDHRRGQGLIRTLVPKCGSQAPGTAHWSACAVRAPFR
jgi:ABC-type glycerol-3-phosphate transport system permease component